MSESVSEGTDRDFSDVTLVSDNTNYFTWFCDLDDLDDLDDPDHHDDHDDSDDDKDDNDDDEDWQGVIRDGSSSEKKILIWWIGWVI